MADCTCADPQAIVKQLQQDNKDYRNTWEKTTVVIDETLYGETASAVASGSGTVSAAYKEEDIKGKHGMFGPVRFAHWAAPEYGYTGEYSWSNLFQAAQLAIALLNASIQQQISDKAQDLAEGYYQHAKYKWERFANKYMPLEKALLTEVSTVEEPEMDCADDRSRAEAAVNTAYNLIDGLVGLKAKAYRLCVDSTFIKQLQYGRTHMLVDTENYNLRDDTWFTDYKSDQRWGRRSNVLNLGRNLGSIAKQYGDVARSLMQDVSKFADNASGALIGALGYYGARFDTVFPATYLQTYGQSAGGRVSAASMPGNAATTGNYAGL